MKFHLLRPGNRFRYQDAVWVKVSPLKAAAAADSESQRLIPRSAEVEPLDAHEQPLAQLPDPLPRERVEAALDSLASACLDACRQVATQWDDTQQERMEQLVLAAKQSCRSRLLLDDSRRDR